jgi:hypothetical protein
MKSTYNELFNPPSWMLFLTLSLTFCEYIFGCIICYRTLLSSLLRAYSLLCYVENNEIENTI